MHAAVKWSRKLTARSPTFCGPNVRGDIAGVRGRQTPTRGRGRGGGGGGGGGGGK
jgi:hypothetical protein